MKLGKRRRRSSDASNDSFLDVMSNAVGVMILVAIVVTINTRDISFVLGTPVLRKNHRLENVNFECVDKHVLHLSRDLYIEAMEVIKEEFERRREPLTRDEVESLLSRRTVSDSNYVMRFPGGLHYERRGPDSGERASEIIKNDSEFRRVLAGLDPREHYLLFFVREDSFGTFRTARRIARKKGFAVGWSPEPKERKMVFGPNGTPPPPPQ
jgi:hypothetical protein